MPKCAQYLYFYGKCSFLQQLSVFVHQIVAKCVFVTDKRRTNFRKSVTVLKLRVIGARLDTSNDIQYIV